MILKAKMKYEKSLGKLKCNICSTRFKENSIIYRTKNILGYICENCNKSFSKGEIEQILHIFKSYGGYFGIFKHKKMPLDDILTEFYDLLSMKNNLKLIELNMKLCHRALLYGYTPKQLIQRMKELNIR